MAKLKQRTLDPIPFTKEGLEKVKHQYEDLLAQRPVLVDRVAVARSYGDLSENAAYHEARKNLGDADRKLRNLKMQLIYGFVADNSIAGVVQLGSSVRVKANTGEEIFSIVGSFEANPLERKLSIDSPIGKALFGKRVGETVSITVPSGVITYKILSVD